ncbi:MAG: hypothetical protein KC535_05040 [Nanoarchaeota archaeon]|nr:hypothetical protein [Nanoarchaeota archaeon]
MTQEKPMSEWSMKNWKNFGIYLLLIGLLMMFVMSEWKTGFGFFAVGFVFTAIFQGPIIYKILKKKNW